MYHVTAEQKAHINGMVVDLIGTAERYYNRSFQIPTITWSSARGRTAGTACHGTWTVNFHPGFVQHFFDEFIQETVAHEVAHLITGEMYPHTKGKYVRFANGRRKCTQKGSPHGSEWKNVMSGVFNTSPSRCHSWTLPGVAARTQATSPDYRCTGCGKELPIGPKRHKKTSALGLSTYQHCRSGQLVLVGSRADTTYSEPMPQLLPVAASTSAPAPAPRPAGTTKAARAKVIIDANRRAGFRPKDIIEMLMEQLEMSKAGATTYYHKYK